MTSVQNYERDYLNLPFESVLRKYRKEFIISLLKQSPHKILLEIGCGPDPFFKDFSDFDKFYIVEPRSLFFKMAKEEAGSIENITIYNDRIEVLHEQLIREQFDFIIIGGFLHEIDNPDQVLQSIQLLCSTNTLIYSYAPNAKSFHRLWAQEMGLIKNIYEKSDQDKLFQRRCVYDIDSFMELFTKNSYKVIESGSYFVKPFSGEQMNMLISSGIADKSCLDGLNGMIKYMPSLGAELWTICMLDD